MRMLDNMACKVAGVCRMRVMRWAIALPIAAIMVGTYILATKPAKPGADFSITIDAGVNHGTVNRLITGSNVEWDSGTYMLKNKSSPQLGVRDDVKALTSALGVSIMLFPGGATGERYHWRNAVGPLADRKPISTAYGTYTPYFGTDEFVDFCSQVNCREKIMIANFCTGTPQEAANWVEYCNSPAPASPDPLWDADSYAGDEQAPAGYFAWLRKQFGHTEPYNVKYWVIGNECYAQTDLRPDMNAQVYGEGLIEFAAAMKMVDPGIKIGAVATDSPSQPDWNRDVLSIAAPSIDFMAPHFHNRVTTLVYDAFYRNSTSVRNVYFPATGMYTFSVKAWARIWYEGEPLDQAGEPAKMALKIDGQPAYTWDVRNLQRYECNATVTSGYHTLSLSFTNDLYTPEGYGRDLFVYGVSYRSAQIPEVSIWYPDDAEQQLLFNDPSLVATEIDDLKALIAEHSPSRAIDILITENNMLYPHEGSPYYCKYPVEEVRHTLRHKAALWEAGFLNVAIREHVDGDLRWLLFDSGYHGDIRDPRRTADGAPLVTPLYYTMKLYSALTGTTLVGTSVVCPTYSWPDGVPTPPVYNGDHYDQSAPKPVNVPYMDAVSTLTASGEYMYLTVVNRSRTEARTQITVNGFRPSSAADTLTLAVWTLVPRPECIIANKDPEMEARNDTKTFDGAIVEPDDVSIHVSRIKSASTKFSYTFSPYSVTQIIMKRK